MPRYHAIITTGPTLERIDPVRYISNFSSGKQGLQIAQALANKDIKVSLVSGPTSLKYDEHPNIDVFHIESAQEMLNQCIELLPADVAVCCAAVCDWRPALKPEHKIKKENENQELNVNFVQNPDILKTLSTHKNRPKLVVGFAAETENLIDNAKLKLTKKQCNWIYANNVANGNVFGADNTHIIRVTPKAEHDMGQLSKAESAAIIAEDIIQSLQ